MKRIPSDCVTEVTCDGSLPVARPLKRSAVSSHILVDEQSISHYLSAETTARLDRIHALSKAFAARLAVELESAPYSADLARAAVDHIVLGIQLAKGAVAQPAVSEDIMEELNRQVCE